MDPVLLILLVPAVCVIGFIAIHTLSYLGNKLYTKEADLVLYNYKVKASSKGKYRITIYDDSGKAVFISSGAGKETRQEALALVDGLQDAVLIEVEP